MFTFGHKGGTNPDMRVIVAQGKRSVAPMRSSFNLDTDHIEAIPCGSGRSASLLLSKERKLTSRVQHLLDCVSRLDASTSN